MNEFLDEYGEERQCEAALESARWPTGFQCSACGGDRHADRRNVWAAESCIRRGLEALFDVGRQVLAKGFGRGVSEYKEIATGLLEEGVVDSTVADVLKTLAGYRNRMVHFYHGVTPPELYEICTRHLGDLERARDAFAAWLREHPDRVGDDPR